MEKRGIRNTPSMKIGRKRDILNKRLTIRRSYDGEL